MLAYGGSVDICGSYPKIAPFRNKLLYACIAAIGFYAGIQQLYGFYVVAEHQICNGFAN
ncbi:hypothetical protein [Paenibacillus sp. FSL R5-0912]|uniref:hypothetical protein n=1 Tax=Paenibacillus sp. FSL R5-0912 TaxID=1536771 RepID=UPI000AAF95EF|nr:hypothetical protein [Paenibacillus sp. FSL R5-0912]